MKKLITLVAILGVASFAVSSAHASVGLRSVGVGAGYASPENIDGTWSVGLQLDFGVPVTNLYVQPFVNYWTKSLDEPTFNSTADFSDWMIGGNVKYVIPTSAANLRPYLQAGVAAHMLSAESSSPFGSFSASETKFGFQGGAGLAYDVNEKWGVFGQGQMSVVEDFNTWIIGGGVEFNI